MKIQTQVTHKMHCVPESADAYQVSQDTKDQLFNTNKKEISSIKSRIATEVDQKQSFPDLKHE